MVAVSIIKAANIPNQRRTLVESMAPLLPRRGGAWQWQCVPIADSHIQRISRCGSQQLLDDDAVRTAEGRRCAGINFSRKNGGEMMPHWNNIQSQSLPVILVPALAPVQRCATLFSPRRFFSVLS